MRKVTESNEMGDKKSNAKGESPHLIAARIHAILARESDTAVVFRRGPSNKTAVLKWDLQTDSFDLGQWFYGSFYPYRCDISPDGRRLVYFAAKYGRGSSMDEYIESRIKAELGEISWFHGEWYYQRMERIVNDTATRRERERQIKTGEYSDCSWTAISRVPYLRAVSLWFNGTGWNGGGLFVDNGKVAINHAPGGSVAKIGGGRFVEVAPPESCSDWKYKGECPMVYFPRLVRDGWNALPKDVFEKPLDGGMTLKKFFICGSPGEGHGCYWERHVICDDSGQVVVDGADWSWADYDRPRARVVFAANGAIYSLRCKGFLAAPKKLHDFNNMKYERIKAPY